MDLFQLTLNKDDWRRYQVEGEHAWSLPPLVCDVCGDCWKTVGEAYPTIDVGELAASFPLETQKPLVFEKFEELRQRLRPSAPEGAPLYPGATFGPFTGVARGRPGHFVWNKSWTMFVQRSALEALSGRGVHLSGTGTPHLTTKPPDARSFDVLEPVAVPLVDLAVESLRQPREPRCPRCGRQPGWIENYLIPSDARIPFDLDLCRGGNNPTLYIASERFADAVRALELTGCVLKPLQRV